MKRLVLAWAATAVAATGAAVAVLGLLGGALTGTSGRVLSGEEVRAALASITPAPTATRGTTSPGPATSTPSVTRVDRLVQTAGGTVIASCEADRVTLRSWSPAQGYSVDGVEAGPGLEASVEFEPGGEGEEVEVTITCRGGRPVTRGR
ncbi:hypothetical protein ACWGH8_15360 [Nonomuraea muscovyensis]